MKAKYWILNHYWTYILGACIICIFITHSSRPSVAVGYWITIPHDQWISRITNDLCVCVVNLYVYRIISLLCNHIHKTETKFLRVTDKLILGVMYTVWLLLVFTVYNYYNCLIYLPTLFYLFFFNFKQNNVLDHLDMT